MKSATFMTALTAATLIAAPALATTVTNQDSKEHTLIVDHGSKESQVKVKAGDSVKVDCPQKCGLRLDTIGYGRQPTDEAKLVINKEGMLQYATE